MTDFKKQGKRNRARGARFELLVRKDLEAKGWNVSKFQSNVDLDNGLLVPAKASRYRLMTTGYPDFICWRIQRLYIQFPSENISQDELNRAKESILQVRNFSDIIMPKDWKLTPESKIIGVECKTRGYLTKEEIAKCRWLLDNKIFNDILIAKKTKVKNRIKIEYIAFKNENKE